MVRFLNLEVTSGCKLDLVSTGWEEGQKLKFPVIFKINKNKEQSRKNKIFLLNQFLTKLNILVFVIKCLKFDFLQNRYVKIAKIC